MKRLKLGLFFAAVCAFFLTATDTHALEAIDYTPPPDLKDSPVIVTGYAVTSAQLGYVQLYNQAGVPVNLDGWRLEYYVNEQTTPVLNVPLSGWIAPNNYVLAADELVVTNPDFTFSPGDTTGLAPDKLRVVPATGSGFAVHEEAVKVGEYQRKKTSSGNYSHASSPFEEVTNPDLYGGGFYDMPIATKLQLVEILANPKKCSPLATDPACSDYVKLYNPTSLPIDLTQFRLRVGYAGQNPSSSNTFILNGVIEPGQYAVMSVDFDGQPIAVTNSGGFVWLEDMYGIVRYENTVTAYPDASADSKKGWAWAYDMRDGAWKWTSQPTPRNTPNVFVLPPEKQKKSSEKTLVPCKPGQQRNPETNRCRSTASSASTLVPCKEGQERNPETNRCRSVKGASTELKPCKSGQERNPETNRCRNIKGGDIPGAAFAVQEVADSPATFAGWWMLGGVGALAAGIGMWEWRREVWSGIRKVGTFFSSSK